jgi:hypothetical protein
MTDPKRILDGALPGSLERVLLDAGGVAEPTEAQCEAAWVALSARLAGAGALAVSSSTGAPAPALAPGAPAAGAGSAGALSGAPAGAAGVTMGIKAVAMLGMTMVLGAAVALVGATAGRAHRVEPAARVPAAVSRASAAPTLPVLPGLETAVPGALALEPVVPLAPRARATAAPLSHPPSPPPSERRWLPRESGAPALLAAESSLVVAARAEVRAGRCGEALDRLREGSDRFRGGALEQERQALRVSALGCARSADEAAAAAAAFVESYPDSPYAATVRPYLAAASLRP